MDSLSYRRQWELPARSTKPEKIRHSGANQARPCFTGNTPIWEMENMLKNMLKATVFATTLTLTAGALSVPAFAEVVYNRGSAAEPESLDPHKTS
ncbi:hypothetical protein IPF36_34330, partial [Cupriavidus sp. IK-TO18]|nr:hypothetical protein [Cupriavidus sp. IK-TO18]